MDAQFEVLAELLVEFLEVVLILGQLLDQLHHLLETECFRNLFTLVRKEK